VDVTGYQLSSITIIILDRIVTGKRPLPHGLRLMDPAWEALTDIPVRRKSRIGADNLDRIAKMSTKIDIYLLFYPDLYLMQFILSVYPSHSKLICRLIGDENGIAFATGILSK
jgi:hypothetical protein